MDSSTARAFGVIKGLVESGAINESRIDQSRRRIMRLKRRLGREYGRDIRRS